jgi:hypothetical protein
VRHAEAALSDYEQSLLVSLRAGNATEHTYRPTLKSLIEALADGVSATNEPKRIECGAPDYVVSRDTPHGPLTIGYMEAKDIGVPLSTPAALVLR